MDTEIQRQEASLTELRVWMESQPHLPKPADSILLLVLYSCDFDLERTEKCVEYYYTIRASFTAVFSERDPESLRIQKGLEAYVIEPLPQLTADGCGIFYAKLLRAAPEDYDFATHMKLMDMRVHVWLREVGCVKGISFIIDMQGGTLRHLHKIGYFNGRKALGYMTEGLPVRLKAVHIVNPTHFMDTVFGLVYPFISAELRSNIHVHHGDAIHDVLPKNCIPDDLNGSGGSIKQLHDNFVKVINSNRDYFIDDEQFKADESKRVKLGLLKRFGF